MISTAVQISLRAETADRARERAVLYAPRVGIPSTSATDARIETAESIDNGEGRQSDHRGQFVVSGGRDFQQHEPGGISHGNDRFVRPLSRGTVVRSLDESVEVGSITSESVEDDGGGQPSRALPQSQVRAVTRPPVGREIVHPVDVEGVAMDVPTGVEQVGLVGDQARVESATEDRPVTTVSIVHVACEQRRESLHRGRQSAVRAVQQPVEVVVHQAIGVNFDLEEFVDLAESLADLDPVVVVEEDGRSVGPTIHDVVPTAIGVGAWWSRHSRS